jgi:acetoin utilization deacetylase AcuC-like enzyme
MSLKVCVVRDERFLLHQTGLVHPERPGRLKSIYRMLDKDFAQGLIEVPAEPATLEQLELVHTPGYITKVLRTAEREFTNLAPDSPAGSRSYLAAWLAAGGCIKGLQALVSGRCEACFALVRPPGAHAQPDRAGGFCIFNNLAIAAKYAIRRYGFRRVLVIDWDIHHGNALQEQFYDSDEVLYVSSHYTGWYPHSGEVEDAGTGQGLGYTINMPVPKEIEDGDILFLYWKVLTQVVKRYRPELILVAAGFDAHQRDPIGRTRLTEKAYYWLTELVMELRDAVRSPPLLLALEGGFDVGALAACVREVMEVLTFQGRRTRVPVAFSTRGMELFEKIEAVHKKYHVWTE